MRKPFEPRYDPLRVFADSTTPAGLYARQKWRHEENTEKWANDFKETVKKLRAGQHSDGSWGNSEITTIERLFGLHLTVREPDDSIESALAWLLHKSDLSRLAVLPRVASNEVLSGLPFTNGCFEISSSVPDYFSRTALEGGKTRRQLPFMIELPVRLRRKGDVYVISDALTTP